MEVIKQKLLFVLVVPLMLVGCVNVKPVRDDGVYKQYNKDGYTYYSFSKDQKKLYSYSCLACDDAEAFEKLEERKKDPARNGVSYSNREKYISFYGDTGKLHWDGRISKNKDGDIENSVFLQKKNSKIVKIEDYRVREFYRLLSFDGVDVIGGEYDGIALLNGRYARVKKNYKYGLYDVKQHRLLLPIKYDWIEVGSSELMPIVEGGKIGFYDKDFKIRIKPQFSKVLSNNGFFYDGVQAVKTSNSKWFFINREGRRISKVEVNKVGRYLSRKFVPVVDGDGELYKYVNLVNNKYSKFHSYGSSAYEGYLIHRVDDSKYVVTNSEGKRQFATDSEGVVPVKTTKGKVDFVIMQDRQMGVISANGKTVVPLRYDIVAPMTGDDGNAIAFKVAMNETSNNKIVGLYDLEGNNVAPLKYGAIESFGGKYYIAQKESDDFRYLGSVLFELGNAKPIFEARHLNKFKMSNLLSFEESGGYGIVDRNGKIIVPPEYHYISEIKNNLFTFYKDGDSYIYNFQGKELMDSDRRFEFHDKFFYDPDEGVTYSYDLKKLVDTGGGRLSVCGDEHFVINDGKEEVFYNYDGSVVVKGGYQSVNCIFNGRQENYILVKKVIK